MGADRRVKTASGTIVGRGAPGADRAVIELALAGEPRVGAIEIGGARVFVKASALRGSAARRHALRKRLAGLPLPRVREYENLRWLRARIFQAPRPLAAAVLWRGGLPRFQVLMLEELSGVANLDHVLPGESPAERLALARELGSEVGRMHSLGFIHRDLFPRNLLVLSPENPRRIVFVDAWRAAPGASLRGPAYDLGCLFLEGAELWSEEEQQSLLDAYAASRKAQGRPAKPRLLHSARRERARLLARLIAEPRRLGGAAPPGPWSAELHWPRG